jgi:hypothetical protein
MTRINASELRARFSGRGKTKRAHVGDSQTRLALLDELWRLGVQVDPRQFVTRPSTDNLAALVRLARKLVQP